MKYSVIAINVTGVVDDYGTALATFSDRKSAENRLEAAVQRFAMDWGLTGPINRQKGYTVATSLNGYKVMFIIEETEPIL